MSEKDVWIRIACDRCEGTGVECHGSGENYYETTCEACEGSGGTEGLASDYDDAQWLREVSQ